MHFVQTFQIMFPTLYTRGRGAFHHLKVCDWTGQLYSPVLDIVNSCFGTG